MAVDKLQDKIRKTKTPVVLDLTVSPDQIPEHIRVEESTLPRALLRFGRELMDAFRGILPAVRFRFADYGVSGLDGLGVLAGLTAHAHNCGYYIFLDVPDVTSAAQAQVLAEAFADPLWKWDGVITSFYIGTDAINPWLPILKEQGKDLFAVLRTANKSAGQVQDLLTGSRLLHLAMADQISRLGKPLLGRRGYSQLGGVGPANSQTCLRELRAKYKDMFLVLDGADYPNANGKTCALAFDKMGYGAIACLGASVTAAWKGEETDSRDYLQHSLQALERWTKNLQTHIVVL